MAVRYKKLLYRMIEEDISNQDLMRMSKFPPTLLRNYALGNIYHWKKLKVSAGLYTARPTIFWNLQRRMKSNGKEENC